jgi:hypothetical protein
MLQRAIVFAMAAAGLVQRSHCTEPSAQLQYRVGDSTSCVNRPSLTRTIGFGGSYQFGVCHCSSGGGGGFGDDQTHCYGVAYRVDEAAV